MPQPGKIARPASWCQLIAPVSRAPRVRDAMTKSCVPSADGLDQRRHEVAAIGAVAVHEAR